MSNYIKKYPGHCLAVFVMLISISLAACGSKEGPLDVPESVQAGDLVDMQSCTYEDHDIEYTADCGTLVVPENRADPNSRLIALPVVRLRSHSANPVEPIFWLAGGPGHPNVHYSPPPGSILDNHDFILVGYRGAEGSVVLECPEIAQALKGLGDDLMSIESLTNIGDANTQCGARLEAEGVDLDGYTIVEIIKDMEAARVGLGYEHIHLLGTSFGTRLEMLYTWMYPENLHRVAMVAVNPPGYFVYEPEHVDRLLELDAKLCAGNPECSTRTDNLAESIRNVVQDMPRRWLIFPIDPGKARVTAHGLLAARSTAAWMFDAFIAAENGDPSGLWLFSFAYDFMGPSANIWGFTMAIGITADYDPERDYLAEMNPPDSIMGAPFSETAWSPIPFTDWPGESIPDEYRQIQPSNLETLLLSGNMDYMTPIWPATEELLPSLSNGQQVVISEFGHSGDIWDLQPEATNHLLTTFFDTGEVDDSLYTYQSMDYEVGMMSFPLIAKILLVVLVLVLIGLIVLLRFIIRRIRRRMA